jgi:uncharacterized protein YsxB (DUF464 family)
MGHAGWDDEGQDIVCAAVSAILQSALLGLSEVARIDVTADRRKGRLDVRWPEIARDDPAARAILETAALSVEYIARQHPENVVAIRERDDG